MFENIQSDVDRCDRGNLSSAKALNKKHYQNGQTLLQSADVEINAREHEIQGIKNDYKEIELGVTLDHEK